MRVATATVLDYQRAFDAERLMLYPSVAEFEARLGYVADRARLEDAARVLACPLKTHAPNWQHGRVLYALTRAYIAQHGGHLTCLDVGTAKGFSALCMQWALTDAGVPGVVYSVDVIDPLAREPRNTVAEVDGWKTLREILAPWPESYPIIFKQSTGQRWLVEHAGRVHVAFLDGKHTYEAVSWEAALLAERQKPGDVVMFDDVQIDGVAKAVKELTAYELEYLEVLLHRKYAIGRRK